MHVLFLKKTTYTQYWIAEQILALNLWYFLHNTLFVTIKKFKAHFKKNEPAFLGVNLHRYLSITCKFISNKQII